MARFSAYDDSIYYYGRVGRQFPDRVLLGWPGSAIVFKFQGTQCKLIFKALQENYIKVRIDNGDWVTYRVADEVNITPVMLSNRYHNVFVMKKTEGYMGDLWFYGIELPDGGQLSPVEPPPWRIEFVGDSITAGYSGWEDESIRAHDAQRTYAVQAATALNAEYRLIAWSGIGLVHNYGERSSSFTMRDVFWRELPENPLRRWDFAQWQPDAMVIFIGHNDSSVYPVPDATFATAYKQFIAKIRAVYPDTFIFVMEPLFEHYGQALNQMVGELNSAGDASIVYVDTSGWINLERDIYMGHPTEEGHQKIAQRLVAVMRRTLEL